MRGTLAAGAKAAAEPRMAAQIESFMVKEIDLENVYKSANDVRFGVGKIFLHEHQHEDLGDSAPPKYGIKAGISPHTHFWYKLVRRHKTFEVVKTES